MKERLEQYRRLANQNADHAAVKAKQAFIPETVFEEVDTFKKVSTPKIKNNKLFGINLTRDNCLIIALIFMLLQEKADMKLIIALIYLLL